MYVLYACIVWLSAIRPLSPAFAPFQSLRCSAQVTWSDYYSSTCHWQQWYMESVIYIDRKLRCMRNIGCILSWCHIPRVFWYVLTRTLILIEIHENRNAFIWYNSRITWLHSYIFIKIKGSLRKFVFWTLKQCSF